ncbi:MAG: guanylate kinase [Candidatus Dadabacteria bacterium]
MREGILFIVSGPSGGGKTSLVKEALTRIRNLAFSVSVTTRKPRDGEVDGKDYTFVSEETFKEMLGQGKFAEYANVHGNLYGTPLAELENARKSGVDMILDIDIQGARQIKEKYGEGVFCFVLPSSFEILKERLIDRGSEKTGDLEKRLTEAKREMEEINNYDYIIINDSFDEAFDCISAVIKSARCEYSRVADRIGKDYFA